MSDKIDGPKDYPDPPDPWDPFHDRERLERRRADYWTIVAAILVALGSLLIWAIID